MQNNKNKKQDQKKKNGVKKKNRFLVIFISVFVSAVLILGVTLGTVAIVKDANSVVSFRGTRMDKKVARLKHSRIQFAIHIVIEHIGTHLRSVSADSGESFSDLFYLAKALRAFRGVQVLDLVFTALGNPVSVFIQNERPFCADVKKLNV